MSQTEKRVEAVAALIADRRKYESWLAALEAKRAETPDHVFLRVRSDYERRLSEVLERLRSQATALNERADALTARLATLVEEERATVDRRSEAELRRAVGEFMPREWDALLKDTAETVARIAAERTTIQTELNEIRELLGGGGKTAARDATAAQGGVKGFQPGSALTQQPPPELPPDELAFLKSLITPELPSNAVTGAPGAGPAGPPPMVIDETEPLLDPRRGGRDTPPLSMNVPGSEAIVIRSDKNGKTLKCAECGALNIPTEWYCERCGSELAPT
jgi:hypothetical protein